MGHWMWWAGTWLACVWRRLFGTPAETTAELAAQATQPLAPPVRFRPAPARRSGGKPKPQWVKDEIFGMYDSGIRSYRALSHSFNRLHRHEGMTVSKSAIKNWLKQSSARALQVRAETRNRFPEFTPANHRWGLDCTGKADSTGEQHCILGIIDHGSRFAPTLQTIERPSAWAILARVFDAVDRHGKPKILRTDNAAVFHSAVFRAVLAAVSIHHEFTELGCPWQNGRIERLFLTLKQVLNRLIPRDRGALDGMLHEFAFWYNEIRPHQHLHGHTPAEVWRGIDPYAAVPKEVLAFDAWEGMLKGYWLRR